VLSIFCDLAKVFHCVNHDIWLYKLNLYRIISNVNEWMKSYVRIGVKDCRKKRKNKS
jgi:hypothetical protein